MPDISALNGTAIDNVAEFDGLTVTAPAFVGLLDTYTGAAAGYSTRKLKTGVTVAARIRRSGDNIEADVEFDSNNEISLTSPISNASSGTYTDLADFVDHSTTPRDAFVKEWKDQSGSGNHATQATPGSQPQLYDATTGLITENGNPAIQWNATNQTFLETGAYDAWSDGSCYTSMVFNGRQGPAGSHTYWDIESGVMRYSSGTTDMFALFYGSNDVPRTSGAFSGQGLHTFYSVASETDAAIYIDGSLEGSTTRTNSVGDQNVTACIASRIGTSQWNSCKYQEIVHWGSDVASNRPGIETDINEEYLIYQPTDAPTSGLLADYTGAAAAYSVRQLSDKAVISMRVRRDSDDEERNFGFDTNGDLDSAGIAAFCQTANGYVTRWWDQSTNGNHADQPVGGTGSNALQPQIYNGTAVITANGQPALQGGASKYLIQPTAVSVSNDLTLLAVADTSNLTTTQLILGIDTDTCATDTQIFTDSNGSRINGRSSSCGFVHSTKSGNNTLFLGVLDYTNDELVARYDGSVQSAVTGLTETPTSIDWNIGANTSGSSNNLGTYQEVIIWLSAQSPTNATGIESNIMTYFNIP